MPRGMQNRQGTRKEHMSAFPLLLKLRHKWRPRSTAGCSQAETVQLFISRPAHSLGISQQEVHGDHYI